MSKISKDEVLNIADLARLEISEEEAEMFASQLDSTLLLAETLNELDTASIEPTSHVFDQENVMREDVVAEGLPLEDVLKNVPDHLNGLN